MTFWADPAGYDINQTLIEYDSQATHGRAAFVGILNTLLVAFLACITATVFGVIAGVLRLSKNWLVSKLMVVLRRDFPQHSRSDLDHHHLYDHDSRDARAARIPAGTNRSDHAV